MVNRREKEKKSEDSITVINIKVNNIIVNRRGCQARWEEVCQLEASSDENGLRCIVHWCNALQRNGLLVSIKGMPIAKHMYTWKLGFVEMVKA